MKRHLISITNIAALKAQPGSDNAILTLGQIEIGDRNGALYYFDKNDNTTAEDTTYFNVVVPNNNIGRWKKVFTRMITLPHGVLVMNAGKKEFFCTSVTNTSGETTINLTTDNTTNGPAIFTDVWYDSSKGIVNANTVNDAVMGFRKSISPNLKQLTHGFYRGGSNGVGVLGVTVLGFRTATSSTNVHFKIEGI